MNEYAKLMTDVFELLAAHGVAEKFVNAVKLRSEFLIRNIPSTPVENRPLAEAQAIFCYELADGAIAAIKAKEAEAKVGVARDNPEEDSLM